MTATPAPDHAQRPTFSVEPNVTPLIDVLLVLLIIFMAAVPAKRKAMVGQLPPADPRQGAQAAGIVLEVGPGGRYGLNRRPLAAERLGAELAAVYAGRPDKTIIVKGEGTARYQEVMTAVDIARGAGVRVVGFDTRRP
ncbi:MAG TPA: biopolymer transporter ExbD [Gemmatimonadaceae bacterium]|nr:biopolymer transporter ExbD [Gemmatimonadaceae bacterium]